MDEIKERVHRRRDISQVDSMRIAFRKRCLELKFDSVSVEGNLTEDQKQYISATITDKKKIFSFNQAKRGYYRVLSTNAVQSFFPTAELGRDSLFSLRLQTTPKNVLSLSVGGNISSSSLMQGDIGQFFTGAGLYFRQHIGVKPLFLYEVMLNAQSFDYFRSSQGILQSNSLARNIRETEYFLTLNMGTPISYNSNILLEFGATAGVNRYDYFPADNYSQYDKKDKTWLSYFTARLKMAQTTLDYNMYPSSGRHRLLEFRYILSYERHFEGTMYADGTSVAQPLKNTFLARLNMEDYYDLGRWFSLGYNLDLTVSTPLDLSDYMSTLMAMPKFTKTVFLHLSGGYFQPYMELRETANGGYTYSDPFPRGGFVGNAALVWQSPIGPISLSCAYYENAEKAKWYPSFNIGFLIFREHGLRN